MNATSKILEESPNKPTCNYKISDFLEKEFKAAYSVEPGILRLKEDSKKEKTENRVLRLIHLDFVIPMGIILSAMLALGFLVYSEPSGPAEGTSKTSPIKEVVEVVVGVGAVGGLCLTAFNIHYQNHYLRKQYSASYVARWFEQDMVDKRNSFKPFREALEDNNLEQLEILLKEAKDNNKSMVDKSSAEILYEKAGELLGFFEQMSQDTLTNVADSGYLKEFFWYIARRCYASCKDIIEYYRTYTGRHLCFADFETLINRWEKEGRPALVKRALSQNHVKG